MGCSFTRKIFEIVKPDKILEFELNVKNFYQKAITFS